MSLWKAVGAVEKGLGLNTLEAQSLSGGRMPEVMEERTKIVKDKEMMGGAAKIEGTRIRVSDIAIRYKKGKTPEEIAKTFTGLDLAKVYTALSYYHSHKDAVDKEIEEREELFKKAQKQ